MWQHRLTFIILLIISLAAWLSPTAQAQPAGAGDAPPAVPAQEQPEVLTRGPVHEAFAQPVNLESQAGLVAPNKPPANIEEEPPAERPEGDNYVWVPGYWSWDTDRRNYIWVSACWRVAPANMSWVPGYWSETDGGWEWVAGFWTGKDVQEIEYLPAPPEAEDSQPLGPPPSPDQIWVPPCHYWNQGHYVPRRGYWLAEHTGWVWVPSHYVWTPRGHVFCEGHWDCSLERRGVLFAPVYFDRVVFGRAGFRYSPSIVVDIGALTGSFFTCPRYSHYYFGDYYDDAYVEIGIFPRFETGRNHTWYDPIYEYDRWHNRRTEPRWEERERHEYDLRRNDRNLRPARTFREQEIRVARLPEPERRKVRVAEPLATVVKSKTTAIKFEQINIETRKKITVQANEVHKFQEQRHTWEAPAGKDKPALLRTDRTPIAPREPAKDPTPRTREKEPPARTEERKTPVKPDEPKVTVRPEERKTPTPPAERKAPIVPPRDVHRTESERVKIPERSVVGKPRETGNAEKAPSEPTGERQHRDAPKETPKDEGKRK